MGRLATASILVLVTGACVEIDGPSLGSEAARLCPGGALRRPAAKPEVVQAFEPCCDGSAHWMPEQVVPSEFHEMLEHDAAQKAFCVPDLLAVNPEHTPKKCRSLFGQPGACISICVAEVADAALPLPRDVCQANERCAPCIDPRDGGKTGACELGWLSCETYPPEGPCKDYDLGITVTSYPACCQAQKGRAHCAPADLVSPTQQTDLESCSSGGGAAGFCVPDDFLMRGGHFTPRRCRSLGGREGRCLSVCVKTVQKDLHSLPQDVCATDERCAPCYDPRTGYGTGACTIGHCDAGPTEPPSTFQPCGPAGSDHALCVPSDAVPLEERCNFDSKGCLTDGACKGEGEICVPRKVVDAGPSFTPKVCYNELTGFLALFKTVFQDPLKALSAMNEYREGRCLSRCLARVRDKANLLGQGSCEANEVCVPCFDPEKIADGKIPTGACHRPSCPPPGS
jgi:hypothetical protein